MTGRAEFSVATQKAAHKRSGGICECGCGRPFGEHPKERPEYDHDMPARLGGDASLENCKAIRRDCHNSKTAKEDLPRIVKVRRGEKDRMGIKATKATKATIPGSKASRFKRKIGGGVVLREEC